METLLFCMLAHLQSGLPFLNVGERLVILNVELSPCYLNSPYSVNCGLLIPSFISPWTWMDTTNHSTTEVVYEHGFNETPIKAEIQVKHPNNPIVFPGIKSANVIKVNQSYIRAGVMCLYNSTHVKIMGPPTRGQMEGYLIFTGIRGQWTGPGGTFEQHKTGYVRARVWHRLDFPVPDYMVTNIELNAKSSTWSGNHNIQNKLLFASIQLILPDGWITEAQGSDSQYDVTSLTSNSNGVVFAATKMNVALWYPLNNSDGYIFTHYGWGSCNVKSECSYKNSSATIRLWGNMTTFSAGTVHTSAGQHIKYVDVFNSDSDILEVFIDVDNGLSVTASFPASGTAMMDSQEHPLGVVYSVNQISGMVCLWYPVTKRGYLVKIESLAFGKNVGTLGVVIWKGKTRSRLSTTIMKQTSTEDSIGVSSTASSTSDFTTSEASTAVSKTTHSRVTTRSSTYSFASTISSKISRTSQLTNRVNTNQQSMTPDKVLSANNSSKFTMTNQNSTNPQDVTDHPSTATLTNSSLETTSPTTQGPSQNAHKDKNNACNFKNSSTNTLNCVVFETGRFIYITGLGRNVYVDFSWVEKGFLLFTCKTGYVVKSGHFNRTIDGTNNTLSGQMPVCIERKQPLTAKDIEQRTKQIVGNLTVDANTTSKYRRDHESARDDRMTSQIMGYIGGIMIGFLILFLIMGDVARLFRHVFR